MFKKFKGKVQNNPTLWILQCQKKPLTLKALTTVTYIWVRRALINDFPAYLSLASSSPTYHFQISLKYISLYFHGFFLRQVTTSLEHLISYLRYVVQRHYLMAFSCSVFLSCAAEILSFGLARLIHRIIHMTFFSTLITSSLTGQVSHIA